MESKKRKNRFLVLMVTIVFILIVAMLLFDFLAPIVSYTSYSKVKSISVQDVYGRTVQFEEKVLFRKLVNTRVYMPLFPPCTCGYGPEYLTYQIDVTYISGITDTIYVCDSDNNSYDTIARPLANEHIPPTLIALNHGVLNYLNKCNEE